MMLRFLTGQKAKDRLVLDVNIIRIILGRISVTLKEIKYVFVAMKQNSQQFVYSAHVCVLAIVGVMIGSRNSDYPNDGLINAP
jgi:hypothetical protein